MATSPEYERHAEFYDHVVPYRQRADVAFFVDLAREADGPVLEAGCGTGRVLIPTARAGVDIEGLDTSAQMLDRCRAALDREAVEVRARVRLHLGDMRAPPVDGPFALVTVPFRSFLHLLTVDDQLQALSALRACLRSGGRFVLDVFNPSLTFLTDPRATLGSQPEPPFTMPDGRRVTRSYRILSRDHFMQTQEVEFAFEISHPDGRVDVERDTVTLRYLFRYEAEHLLQRSGFRVDAVYADYDRRPFGSTYPGELIFVATRL
jgi:SAM-dependent methyltransferase